jgi:arabinan endo-1,5-alpha-L-arabinosidase
LGGLITPAEGWSFSEKYEFLPMAARRKAIALWIERVESRRLLAAAAFIPGSPLSVFRAEATVADPGAIAGVTDPSIIKQGGTYYVFSSGQGIEVRASVDLRHWRELGSVFNAVPAWALAKVPGASGIWAPDISFFAGAYHLYYAVSTFGSQRSVIGLATNTTLDPRARGYRWVDRGEVIESRPGRDNFNAIDPNIITGDDGSVGLAFGSQWSGIKLLQLDPSTGMPARSQAPGGAVLTARPVPLASRRGAGPIEAPFVLWAGGHYYLFVSFGNCCQGTASTYKIMVGRSDSLAGPYVDRSGRPMTRGGGTVVLAGSGRFRGPGSCAVLSNGGRDYLVYHAYDAQADGAPTLQIRPLSWTPDGWPIAGDLPFS